MLGSMIEAFSKLTLSRGVRDDDGVDQLHHLVTVAIFAALGVAVGTKQYVGDPIHCWTPAQFKDSHHNYAEHYCWISEMYNIPMDEPIPLEVDKRLQEDISFYRWVPVMFLIQAVLFKVPNILWKQLKTYSGINIEKIVRMAEETDLSPSEERKKYIHDIAHFIDRWLRTSRVYKYNILIRMREKFAGVFCFVLGKRHGTYLTGLYLFCKTLNCINVICQFVLMTRFLGIDFFSYGFEVLQQLNDPSGWQDWDNFPRVALCDFEIRQLQNIQRYTVQCVLSINLFTEKMYAFTWFWLAILTVATYINFTKWVVDIFFKYRRDQFIQKHLGFLKLDDSKKEKQLFQKFVRQYLRDDGVFLIRSVRNNTGNMLAIDLVQALWERFKDMHKTEDHEDDELPKRIE